MNNTALPFQLERPKNSRVKYLYNNYKMCLCEYIDNSLHVLMVVFTAEIIARIFKACNEFIYYRNHYWPNQMDILYRTFSTTVYSKISILITIGGMLARFGVSSHLISPTKFFAYMPLYWIALYGAKMVHSQLDYSYFIRERTGLDYGEGMATSYFHGYLKHILPADTDQHGIKERIELFEAQHNIEFPLKKLVIIIPDILYVSPTIQSKYLEKAHELTSVKRGRAGVLRNFKNDVYRITKKINGRFYYVVLEGATPLLSFFDALNFQLTGTWQMRELQREILLKFYKTIKNLIQQWPETQNEVQLIFYKSQKSDGSTQDVGELIISHIEKEINGTIEANELEYS